jgi:hypothetical protein
VKVVNPRLIIFPPVVRFHCDYFLKVETIFSPRRNPRIIVDALKDNKPINITPLLGILSPMFIRNRERTKQIELSKAIVLVVFFILCVVV